MQLEKPARKRPITLDEAQRLLGRAAHQIGTMYGVAMGVGRHGDGLLFVEDDGSVILDEVAPDGPLEIPCASLAEIESGEFLKLFAARSLYAALCAKFVQNRKSENET